MEKEPNKPENNEGIEDSHITTKQTRLSTFTDGKSFKPGQERDVIIRDLVNLPSTTYGTFGLYRYPAKFIPHVVAFVLVVVSALGFTYLYNTPYSYASVDINPSLTIDVNIFDRVININGVNSEGEEMSES